MFKSFALTLLFAEASAIKVGHHHHHHAPRGHMMVMDDPTCTTSQETGHCLLTHYKDEGKSGHDVEYKVPDFGKDHDIVDGLKFAEDAELEQDHKWVIPTEKPKPGPPKDYFVPNFGVDQEIADSHANLAVVEGVMGHNLTIPKSTAVRENKDVPPAQINPPLDENVRTSLANTEAAELEHGKWTVVWN